MQANPGVPDILDLSSLGQPRDQTGHRPMRHPFRCSSDNLRQVLHDVQLCDGAARIVRLQGNEKDSPLCGEHPYQGRMREIDPFRVVLIGKNCVPALSAKHMIGFE